MAEPHSFQLEKPGAASIALALEYSTASARQFQELNPPIRAFLERAPEDDSYALAVYSRSLMVAFEFTRRANVLREVYTALGIPLWNEINTYDAVYGMLERLGRIPGRRVLVLIGSGTDTLSGHTLEDVQKKIAAENVTVFAIGTGSLFREAYGWGAGTPGRPRVSLGRSPSCKCSPPKAGAAHGFRAKPPKFRPSWTVSWAASPANTAWSTSRPKPPAGKFESVKVTAAGQSNQENFKVLVRQGWR